MTLAVLVELQPWDPWMLASVPLRMCSHDDVRLTSLNGVVWWPAIARLPRLSLRLFDGGFGGKMDPGGGDMEISLEVFPEAARYAWGDRPAKIWIGELGAAFADFTLLFDGLVRTARIEGGRIDAELRVNDDWLDGPLLTNSYEGTTGAEGSADLKGVPKPLAIGAPRYVEGRLIDPVNTVVQLHGYGPMNAVPVAMDKLVRFPASVVDLPSYDALVAASIPAGQYATARAVGLVRHGAPADSVLSYMVEGDIGSTGGFVRTPGAVIRRLAEIAGATTSQVDVASLAALDAAVPRNLSRFISEQTTPREVIGEIAGAANASAGVSWLGKLFACRIKLGSAPLLTLRTDGTALPPVGDLAQLEVAPPFWRMQMKGTRTIRVHAQSEVALNVLYVDMGDFDPLKTYREGSLVRQPADGRRYRYINPSPSAGNAPPNGTYWEVHEEAPGSLIPVDFPGDVTEFDAQIIGDTCHLRWEIVEGNGLSHYVIKFQAVLTDAAWANSVTLIARVPIAAAGATVPAMNGTYSIKAVNREGIESAAATMVSTNVQTLDALNVVATITEDPAFAGVRTNLAVDPSGLILSGGSTVDLWGDFDAIANIDFGELSGFVPEGFYDFANTLDLGSVYTSRLTATIEAAGNDIRSNVDDIPDVDAVRNFDGADPSAWNVELQVATSDDGVTFASWRTFTIGDYTARAFKWRARLSSTDIYVTPILSGLSVTVDMPDRDERGNDIACPAGGATIYFSRAFRAVPAIAITGQNLATGDYVSLTAKGDDRFTLRFFNSVGAGVARTFDWIAKGYGVKS